MAAIEDMEAAGHRVKRVKTENLVTAEVVSRLEGKKRAALDRPAQASENVEMEDVAAEGTEREPDASSLTKSISQAKVSGVQDPSHVDPVAMKSTSETSQNCSHLGAGATSPGSVDAVNFNIDFSSAPSDPLQLSIWVAHQIRQYAVVDGSSSDIGSGHDESRRSSHSHPPGRHIREKIDHGVDAATVADRDKMRDGNRRRKQSWRNTHHERSMS